MKRFFILLCCCMSVQFVAARKPRYVAFVHGYNLGGGTETCPTQAVNTNPIYYPYYNGNAERWFASGTPQELVSTGQIDGYIFLEYCTNDKKTEYVSTWGGANSVWTTNISYGQNSILYGTQNVLTRLSQNMADFKFNGYQGALPQSSYIPGRKQFRADMETAIHSQLNGQHFGKDAEWILVGHSLGGIVSRALEKHIKSNQHLFPNMNVKGVIAVDSPLQGSLGSLASYGAGPGLVDIKPTLDTALDDITAGPKSNLGMIAIGNVAETLFTINSIYKLLFNQPIASGLDKAEAAAHLNPVAFNDIAISNRSRDFLSPSGTIIQHINQGVQPANRLSIQTPERSGLSARIASAGVSTNTSTVACGTLEQGDELKALNAQNCLYGIYKSFRTVTEASRDFLSLTPLYQINPIYHYYNNQAIQWGKGERRVRNLDPLHTTLINAYDIVQRQVSYQTMVCWKPVSAWEEAKQKSSGNGFDTRDFLQSDLAPCAAGQEPYQMTTITTYLQIPAKNDAVLTTPSMRWSQNDPKESSNSFNEYFPEEQQGYGFNHAEVIFAKRRYSYPEENFYKGDKTPIFDRIERYIDKLWPNTNTQGGS
jgi:pimeloyl-ACP methyl ester carboxylesterase